MVSCTCSLELKQWIWPMIWGRRVWKWSILQTWSMNDVNGEIEFARMDGGSEHPMCQIFRCEYQGTGFDSEPCCTLCILSALLESVQIKMSGLNHPIDSPSSGHWRLSGSNLGVWASMLFHVEWVSTSASVCKLIEKRQTYSFTHGYM